MRDLGPNRMILLEPHYRVMEREIEFDEKKKRELMKRLGKL
jgi:hypothetical protein